MDFDDCKVTTTETQTSLLAKVDEFEAKLVELEKLKKEEMIFKANLKRAMLKLAEENNAEQLKWKTNKGIQITLSVGKPAVLDKILEEKLDEDYLKENYPDIYKECLKTNEKLITVKNESYDRLVITLPKGE